MDPGPMVLPPCRQSYASLRSGVSPKSIGSRWTGRVVRGIDRAGEGERLLLAAAGGICAGGETERDLRLDDLGAAIGSIGAGDAALVFLGFGEEALFGEWRRGSTGAGDAALFFRGGFGEEALLAEWRSGEEAFFLDDT